MYLDQPEPERRNTRLSVRIAVLTGLALALFSVVFLRLWYLQVLSADDYRQQANDNRIREVRVQPPRGDILDRNGKVLVDNQTVMELVVDPGRLPKPGPRRAAVFRRLKTVTGMTPRGIRRTIRRGEAEFPGGPVTLRQGIGTRKVYYLRENQRLFPGVSVEQAFRRQYRRGALAAHLFGIVGEVNAEQLKLPRYRGLQQGDAIGQSGIEYTYDRFLRGTPGATRISVDALGRPRGRLASKPARAGDNVRLSIDSDLQAAGEEALDSYGLPGAFVAMNPNDGEVLAMGSAPSFDPEIFTRPITERRYKALTSAENDSPLTNRAIQGGYPTGSAFKPITAVAALEDGLIEPDTIVNDTGELKVDVLTLHNAEDAVYGPIDMSDALKVSSDIYFFRLGLRAPAEGNHGAIQDWARSLGIGQLTGIDLPAELPGLLPTPAWRNRLFRDRERLNCDLCPDRPWRAGDNINLAVGQGDLQASPLQMAVAFSAIANGGTIVRPHVAKEIENVDGEPIMDVPGAPRRKLDISKQTLGTVRQGLRRASMEEGGTSYPVFGNFPFDVAGKTGTAERGTTEEGFPLPDQAWFVVMAPADDPEIVVAVTLERGGFGADTAAPIAARMLEQYFDTGPVDPVPVAEGQTHE